MMAGTVRPATNRGRCVLQLWVGWLVVVILFWFLVFLTIAPKYM